MTLLTVDAKLMPILPLIARPESTRALVVAFGMGSAFRAALIAGLKTDAVELVPSVPKMFGWYYPDAEAVLADPNGRVIVTDGRNHLELTERALRHHRHRPAAADRELRRRGHLVARVLRGGPRPPDRGGIMMQWVPYGGPADDFHDHIRTFAVGLPARDDRQGRRAATGIYMLGSIRADRVPEANIRAVLARPGVLADISSAYDSPAKTVDDWVAVIARQTWLTRRPSGRTPARVRSSPTTGRDPNTSCCGDCSATRVADAAVGRRAVRGRGVRVGRSAPGQRRSQAPPGKTGTTHGSAPPMHALRWAQPCVRRRRRSGSPTRRRR